MQRSPLVLASLALALGGDAALAQAPAPAAQGQRPAAPPPTGAAEVRGTVRDSAGVPLPGAAVSVRRKADGSLAAGVLGAGDGSFRIQGLVRGAYVLRVSKIGFAPKLTDFAVTEPTARVDVGEVRLARVAVELAGVRIEAEQATMTIEPDRNAYRAKDVAPAAGNASEVLEAVPSVQVDGEGRVSLRGNENVVVQINGRPTPMRGPQLAQFLKQVPGAIVERVEVVPNPSAKYDPEGMAGIINIVLKQDADLGLSAGFTVAGMNEDRYNGSGNVGYQAGRVTLFGSYGYNTDRRGITGINDRERYTALHALESVTEQDIAGNNRNWGHNLTGNFDYRLNRRDVLSNALVVNFRNQAEGSTIAFTERDANRNATASYLRPRDNDVHGTMLDYTAAWKRTITPRSHELAAELRVNRTVDEDDNFLSRRASAGAAATELERNEVDAVANQLTAQLDYTRQLSKVTKLETGYRGNLRMFDRDFGVLKDSAGSGTWTPSALSNSFEFVENVQAAYGVLSRGFGKLEVQGGLRAEYTDRDFELAARSYPYDYLSLFPSAMLSYKRSDAVQGRLSYSRRVRRPNTQELNPFPQFFDAQNVFLGNPDLRPEFTDAIELGVTRAGNLGTLQFTPFFRRTTNIIRVDIDTDAIIDGRDVTTVSFRNLATSNSFGADLNGSMRLGPMFNGFAAFNVFRLVTDGGSTSAVGSDAIGWSARVNGTANLTRTFSVQGMYFYRAPMEIERGRFAAQQGANIVLRQKVYGDRGTFALRIADPFNTIGMAIRTGDDRIIQVTERQFGVRGVFASFQYAYGRPPRVRPRQDDGGGQGQTGFP